MEEKHSRFASHNIARAAGTGDKTDYFTRMKPCRIIMFYPQRTVVIYTVILV